MGRVIYTQCQVSVVTMGTWSMGDSEGLWVVRISSHSTVCLTGSPLEQGCSLIIFFIVNKNTWERERHHLPGGMYTLVMNLYVRKVVTRSLTRFLLVYDTYRHVWTKRHTDMNFRKDTRNEQRSPEKNDFFGLVTWPVEVVTTHSLTPDLLTVFVSLFP
jgi:hypothetical protein